MEHREGVGQKREQLMMRKSTSLGFFPERLQASSNTEHRMVSATLRAASMERSAEVYSLPVAGSMSLMTRMVPGGQWVASPVPLFARSLPMKVRESSVYTPRRRMISLRSSRDTRHSSGASYTAKSMMYTGGRALSM